MTTESWLSMIFRVFSPNWNSKCVRPHTWTQEWPAISKAGLCLSKRLITRDFSSRRQSSTSMVLQGSNISLNSDSWSQLIMKLVRKQPQLIQTMVALLTHGKFRYRFYCRKELTLSTVQTVLHLSGLPKQDLHNGNTSLHATWIEEISQSPTPVWKL